MNDSNVSRTADHFAGTKTLYKILFAVFDGVGISGNLLVIFTILLNRNMRSSVFVLLCNLAISDLLFAILVPFHINTLMENYHWQYGEIFCKLYFSSYRLLYAVSMVNLMVITVQRYRAARYPLAFRFKSGRTSLIIVTCWILGVVISLPFFFVMKYTKEGDRNICFQEWPNEETKRAYYFCVYILMYILPFFSMAVLYGNMFVILRKPPIGNENQSQRRHLEKRKRMSLIIGIIVVVFFFCWTPYNILEFIRVMRLQSGARTATSFNYSILAALLSAVFNPILLNFMSSQIREGIKTLLQRCSCEDSENFSVNHFGSAAARNREMIEIGRRNSSATVDDDNTPKTNDRET